VMEDWCKQTEGLLVQVSDILDTRHTKN
jgi:hypothetical protein